jgi:hypothetical protein
MPGVRALTSLQRVEIMARLYPLTLLIPVVLVISGCRSTRVELNERQKQIANESAPAIDDYLAQNIGGAGFGGRVFCAHEVLDVEGSGESVKEYVFAVCQEYDVRGGGLREGTGAAMPVALQLGMRDQAYQVISYQTPEDSPRYEGDVKRMFPEKTHPEIFYGDRKGVLAAVEQKAKSYYGTQ